MNFDIDTRTIFKTLTGSRVYGTSSEDSDYDYRGVAIAPLNHYFGFQNEFQQHESSNPDDLVVYDFRKFLKLATDNNPNVMELLYIPEHHWTVVTPAWRRLIEHREWFLSKKCYHTYRGYAHSQMRRVVSHRSWLLQDDVKEPTRADFELDPHQREIPHEVKGAADALVRKFLLQDDIEEDLAEVARHDKSLAVAFRQRIWEFLEVHLGLTRQNIEESAWITGAKRLGFETNFLELLQREKQYQQARRHYESWLKWKAERNPARKAIEARCGFDAKHVAHTYRLIDSCFEILRDGVLTVDRSQVQDPQRNAAFLKDIKAGVYKFEELELLYHQREQELDAVYQSSTLQHQPRRNDIDDLGVDILKQYLRAEL